MPLVFANYSLRALYGENIVNINFCYGIDFIAYYFKLLIIKIFSINNHTKQYLLELPFYNQAIALRTIRYKTQNYIMMLRIALTIVAVSQHAHVALCVPIFALSHQSYI